MPNLKRNRSTKESRDFWQSAQDACFHVLSWDDHKRANRASGGTDSPAEAAFLGHHKQAAKSIVDYLEEAGVLPTDLKYGPAVVLAACIKREIIKRAKERRKAAKT